MKSKYLDIATDGDKLQNSRSVGLDIIRVCAILFVIGSHFFLHTSFNSATFHGAPMFFLSMLATLTLINVPLFMMLTGYLNVNKRVSKKYYKGCIRVIVAYVFFSLVTIVFRELYLGEHYTPVQWFLKITDFSAIPYAWYIELWIGLFLLTPFLNILWKGIETKRNKRILIITLFICSAFPDFLNRYGVHLVPGYWEEAAYPLCFFYIGSYIREYQPKCNVRKTALAILGLCLINPVANLIISFISPRPMLHLIGDGNGIVGIPLATLFFLMCYKAKVSDLRVRNALMRVSLLALDMYLVSYIFDRLWHPYFRNLIGDDITALGPYYPIIIGVIAASSFLAAWAKDIFFNSAGKLYGSIFSAKPDKVLS